MNATKHTPGPWHTGTTANTKYSIYEQFGQQISESFTGVFIGNHPSSAREANARLIAAAPELFEFVREWLERQGTDNNYMTEKARTIMAKVTVTEEVTQEEDIV